MRRPASALVAVALSLSACGVTLPSYGSTSDNRRISGHETTDPSGVFLAGYHMELSDGTTCEVTVDVKDYRAGLRSYPIRCSDGTHGTAVFDQITGPNRGISFRLTNGTTGHVR